MNPLARKAAQTAAKANVWLYRRTNGRVGGRGLGRLPLLLLTVPGRNSGTPRTVPIAYLDHKDGYLVVGTGMGGSRAIPQWVLNLQAAGTGRIRIGGQEHDVDAHLASNIERDAWWPLIAGRAAHFARWQARTRRSLPVIVLTVRSPSGLGLRAREDRPRRASHGLYSPGTTCARAARVAAFRRRCRRSGRFDGVQADYYVRD